LDFIEVRRHKDASESGPNRHDSHAPGAYSTATRADDTTRGHAPSAGSPRTTETSGHHGKHRMSTDISERHRTTTTANAIQHDESERQLEHLSLRFQADPRPRCQMFSLHHQAALPLGRRLRRRLGRAVGPLGPGIPSPSVNAVVRAFGWSDETLANAVRLSERWSSQPRLTDCGWNIVVRYT
jgi:hypothetical protein